ncbi:hypothetical protein T05_1731, partial [Trichinella murrelli]
MYHSPTNDILIFTHNAGVRLLPQSNFWCRDGTFKISHPGNRRNKKKAKNLLSNHLENWHSRMNKRAGKQH